MPKKSSTQFFIGAGIGVVAELAMSAISSFVVQITIFGFGPKDQPDMNIIGSISIIFPLAILITLLIIIQKKFKLKFLTLGIAAGWIGITLLFGLTLFLVVSRLQ